MSTIQHSATRSIHDRSTRASRDSRRRRLLEGFAFAAVWVVLGYALPVNDETYLLMGVPLTVAFQVLVRRRPLRELWVRDATSFTLDKRGLLLAAVVVATPAYYGAHALPDAHWWLIGWYVAGFVGAVGAAFALRATTPVAMLRSAALPMAVGAGGMAVVIGGIHVATGTPVHVLAVLGTAAKYVAIYFPVTFVLEEVAFRGALDAHVHHDGEGGAGSLPCSSLRSGDSGTCPSLRACRSRSWSWCCSPSTASSGCPSRSPGVAAATSPEWRSPTRPSTQSATHCFWGSEGRDSRLRQPERPRRDALGPTQLRPAGQSAPLYPGDTKNTHPGRDR